MCTRKNFIRRDPAILPHLFPPSFPLPPLRFFLPVPVPHLHQAQLLHNRHPLGDTPKDRVLSIEPRRGGKGEEELTAVRVGTRVGLGRKGEGGREGGRGG